MREKINVKTGGKLYIAGEYSVLTPGQSAIIKNIDIFMNADQLWETTMNPETRTLIRVTIEDLARAERRVNVLMGDKVEPRRKWIEDNVKFTLEESGVF